MGIAPIKADHAILRMNCDTIAVAVLMRRGDNWAHRNFLEFADAVEDIAYLPPFNRQFMFVIDVLIRAAAAVPEIGTLRRHAMWRAFPNIEKLRLCELFFLAHNFRRNSFSLNCIRNKNSSALVSTDTLPAKGNVVDFEVDNAHVTETLL